MRKKLSTLAILFCLIGLFSAKAFADITPPDGSGNPIPIPTGGPLFKKVTAIEVGYEFACALKGSKTVDCWGKNNRGQLGNGTQNNQNKPVKVSGLSEVVQIATGVEHACAVKKDKTVWCWGANSYGQLGDLTTTDSSVPKKVLLNNVKKIVAGGFFTCAEQETEGYTGGVIYCWGRNKDGELGINANDIDYQATPSLVVDLDYVPGTYTTFGFYLLDAGKYSVCVDNAGMEEGQRCWGRNSELQIGDASAASIFYKPEIAPSLFIDFQKNVSLGAYHTCGFDNVLMLCWGLNTGAQVIANPNISEIAYNDPANTYHYFSGPDSTKQISAGDHHTVILKQNGSVVFWGSHNPLETFQQKSKVKDVNLIGVTSVSAGNLNTCALTNDGNVWCWGYNQSGQLGDGTNQTHDETNPAKVDFY